MSYFPLTNSMIFQRGRSTTNQYNNYKYWMGVSNIFYFPFHIWDLLFLIFLGITTYDNVTTHMIVNLSRRARTRCRTLWQWRKTTVVLIRGGTLETTTLSWENSPYPPPAIGCITRFNGLAGKSHKKWENRWFPVDFPLNQSIDKYVWRDGKKSLERKSIQPYPTKCLKILDHQVSCPHRACHCYPWMFGHFRNHSSRCKRFAQWRYLKNSIYSCSTWVCLKIG